MNAARDAGTDLARDLLSRAGQSFALALQAATEAGKDFDAAVRKGDH